MLHSSLLEKADGDLNTGQYCQCQMSPHVVETVQRGCLAFNQPHPVSFLCLSDIGGMSNPFKPTIMTPSIP